MPRTRAKSRAPSVWLWVAMAAAAGALLLWYASSRENPGQTEGFRKFSNLTPFSKEQVWGAYRFSLANPGRVLNYIPCFCGCVYHGDTNNRDCYIDGFDGQGSPIFDPHAAG